MGSKNKKHLRGSIQAIILPLAIILTVALWALVSITAYMCFLYYSTSLISFYLSIFCDDYVILMCFKNPHEKFVEYAKAILFSSCDNTTELIFFIPISLLHSSYMYICQITVLLFQQKLYVIFVVLCVL